MWIDAVDSDIVSIQSIDLEDDSLIIQYPDGTDIWYTLKTFKTYFKKYVSE